mgnify:CR=1 FL=1
MNLELLSNIFDVATSVIGTAAVIASVTPTPKDDAIVAPIKKLLDFLAFNFGHAKNKE